MGRYYYVTMVNPTSYSTIEGGYVQNETWKLAQKYVINLTIVYSGPSGLAIRNVKETTKRETRKVLGFNVNNDYTAYDPFFMICEDCGDHLEEVITGRKYKSWDHYGHPMSQRLVLKKEYEISSTKVREMLSTLSNEDVLRYRQGIKNLEYAIRQGYEDDMARENKQKRENDENDAYIKSFRRKYGK